MSKCRVEGCNQEVGNNSTGLCHMHHLRYTRYGTTDRSRNNVEHSKKCIVEGCEREQQTNIGYCLMHYKRFRRYGTTELPIRKPAKCEICGKPAVARRLCSRHYTSYRKYGDPRYVDSRRNALTSRGYKKGSYENYSLEHREIASKILVRPLTPKDIVHHIDCNKSNNDENNIYICTASEHSKLHHQLEKCAAELFRAGYIKFDNGEYKTNI